MSFDKEEIQQLEKLFDANWQKTEKALEIQWQKTDEALDNQRSLIMFDVRSLIKEELDPLKKQLDQLFKMSSEDIQVAYHDIETLKSQVKKHDMRITVLEH